MQNSRLKREESIYSEDTIQSLHQICREQLKGKDNIVLVCGAGVTMSSYPAEGSWLSLLKKGVEFAEAEDCNPATVEKLTNILNKPQSGIDELLTVGDELTKVLIEKDLWSLWLRDAIEHEFINASSPLLQALAACATNPRVRLATTNYDFLLERACSWEQAQRLPAFTWRDLRNELDTWDNKKVCHLHGHARDPSSVVLGNGRYESLNRDDWVDAFRHVMMLTNVLIFVGCGATLKDPAFDQIFSKLKELDNRDRLWFQLVANNEAVGNQILKAVPYGTTHDQLPQFINEHLLIWLKKTGTRRSPQKNQGGSATSSYKPPHISAPNQAIAKIPSKYESELRDKLNSAKAEENHRRIASILTDLLELVKQQSDPGERMQLMSEQAFAVWLSGSLLTARDLYHRLADEAQSLHAAGQFSDGEAVATDAYRRAIGIDLELVEPLSFLNNTISVLERPQTHVTFNSILNRLVLFCARFGFPLHGYCFGQLSFDYIGNGERQNEGTVLCAELSQLYAPSAPHSALKLLLEAGSLAKDEPERLCNVLDRITNDCLHHGKKLDFDDFETHLLKVCSDGGYSETSTRASLLLGSLFLRDRNLQAAEIWIKRTETKVQLYRMKQFELALRNDQVLHALLADEHARAHLYFEQLRKEFDRITDQLNRGWPLVERAYLAARKVTSYLQREPSHIPRPESSPMYCAPLGEVGRNITVMASILGLDEITVNCATFMQRPKDDEVNRHRQLEIQGKSLILGAY